VSAFSILALDARPRAGFDCATDALNRYFQNQVTQDMRRRIAACYIALHQPTGDIAGYYTLSASDIPLTDLPPDLTKRLPRYPTLPAARLGRLAVDQRFKGQKLGAALLANAILRAAANKVAVYAMIVDPKDAPAESFYQHHGFTLYGSVQGKLMAPLASLLPRL
jgi:GNAT superfamily N-acetyltransferase